MFLCVTKSWSCQLWSLNAQVFTSHYLPVVHETLKPFTRSGISWHPESVIPALQRNQDTMVCHLLAPSVWICVETSCWICIRTLCIYIYMYTYIWCIHIFGVYICLVYTYKPQWSKEISKSQAERVENGVAMDLTRIMGQQMLVRGNLE